jgi:hypothetical protein
MSGVSAGEGSRDDPKIREWLIWVERLVYLVQQVKKAPKQFKSEHVVTLAAHGASFREFESYLAGRAQAEGGRIRSVGRQLSTAKSWLAVASYESDALAKDPTHYWCRELFKHEPLDLWELFRVSDSTDPRAFDSPPPPNIDESVRYARVPVVVTAEDDRAYRLNLVLAVVKWDTHGDSPCIEHPLFSLNARTTGRFTHAIAVAWRDAIAYANGTSTAHIKTSGLIGIWSIHPHFDDDVPDEIRKYWYVDDTSAYGAALLAWKDLLHGEAPSTERLILAAIDDSDRLIPAHLLDKKIGAVPIEELSEILVWDEAAAKKVAEAIGDRDPRRRIALRWVGEGGAGRPGGPAWNKEALMVAPAPAASDDEEHLHTWGIDAPALRRRTKRARLFAGVALVAAIASGVCVIGRARPTAALPIISEFKDETYPAFAEENSGFAVVCKRDGDHLNVSLAAQAQGRAGWGVCCVASSDPVDLSRFKTATVRLDNHTPGKEFEIKLERAESSGAGQKIIPAVLSRYGLQDVRISLEPIEPSLLSSVKRVCFSTTVEKMRRPPLEVALDVERVTFE